MARLLESVEQLWDEGVVVVTAAGNQGPRPGSITAPGSSKKYHSGLQRFVGRAQCYFRERTNGRMRVQAGYCGTWK